MHTYTQEVKKEELLFEGHSHREVVLGLLKGTARQRKEKKDEDRACAVEAPGPGEASTLGLT